MRSTLVRLLARILRVGSGSGAPVEPLPLRAEVYASERLERHAGELAAQQTVRRGDSVAPLLTRLRRNGRRLERICQGMAEGLRSADGVAARRGPAAEWLAGNRALIAAQVATARQHLPRGYGRQLPTVAAGPGAGAPRVHALVLEYVAHSDGRLDREALAAFLAAYQQVTLLTTGELWAVPIMLRLALVENLRRAAVRVEAAAEEQGAAAAWAARVVQAAAQNPSAGVVLAGTLASERPDPDAAFAAELHRRLQDVGPAAAPVTTWLEQRLHERGAGGVAAAVLATAQAAAADLFAIEQCIGSLRALDQIDWRDFVEPLSVVDRRLRSDPGYAAMDFMGRDRYRHAVEELARWGRMDEDAVAATALELAQKLGAALAAGDADAVAGAARRGHVGHLLVAEGRPLLERRLGLRPPLRRRFARLAGRAALPLWLATVLALTIGLALTAWALLSPGSLRAALGPVGAVLAALAWVIAASQTAVALANAAAVRLVLPRPLLRLDHAAGIPAAEAALVAVPTLLRTPADAVKLIEGLELRHLANRDRHLRLCLLTDGADADAEELPADAAALDAASAGIAALNERHRDARGDVFFLLHRPRRWNPRECRWMGRERKRGKLADLNALLLTGDRSAFSHIVGDLGALGLEPSRREPTGPESTKWHRRDEPIVAAPRQCSCIRHVITLDTDTQLPPGAARALTGIMAHPLNRPVHDPRSGRVVAGHAVLQPRATIALPSARRSAWARLAAGDAGIDFYTRQVSDVYQDLYGQGSFVGKGIYDVAAFDRALHRRLPDDAILSHDLIEGCYARAALAGDVLVVEDTPAAYLADAARRQRWVRGDWQLLPWLLPRCPAAGGWTRTVLDGLARWKLFDNLRRSLVAPAVLAALLLAAGAGAATAAVLAALLLAVLPLLAELPGLLAWRPRRTLALRQHLRQWCGGLGRRLADAALQFCFLPYEAALHLDAIGRTLLRLLRRRSLLEWQTAAEAERLAARGLGGIARTLWWAPAGSLLLLGLTACHPLPPAAWIAPGLLALAWCSAPVLAWLLGRPAPAAGRALAADELAWLRRQARRTWLWFETLVGAEDRHLPPDHHQERPGPQTAHRTSPTNIGFALAAELAAVDLGHQPPGAALRRLGASLGSLAALERHRGHFFNWYDTRSGAVLSPRYVSTVDSGNCCALLLATASGLRELVARPPDWAAALTGLEVEAELLAEAGVAALAAEAGPRGAMRRLKEAIAEAAAALAAQGPRTLPACLDWIAAAAAAPELAGLAPSARRWAAATAISAAAWRAELIALLPWLLLPRPEEPAIESLLTEAEADACAARLAALVLPGGAGPELGAAVAAAREQARTRLGEAARLAALAEGLAQPDFGFLYDPRRRLFAIGYDVGETRLDRWHYDLLASEARLASYLAIAQGQIPQEHWFALGRAPAPGPGAPTLLSWSGSMFEYLMADLLLPSHPGTVLDAAGRGAVARQIAHGGACRLPWGVSECAYHQVDAGGTYQYRAFGVPGLGIKSGLGRDRVVAPYASALALLVDAPAALANLRRLEEEGLVGEYGFYEALDATPARLPDGRRQAVVRSWMAHHQGMSLLAFAQVLVGDALRRRFLAQPVVRAAELLLQERALPLPVLPGLEEGDEADAMPTVTGALPRLVADPATPAPELGLLSNGRYHVALTAAGGGVSRWQATTINRWRGDPTRDAEGLHCYVRETDRDGVARIWSLAWQPTLARPQVYEAEFAHGRIRIRREDAGIEARTEVAVSPEDDVELRRTVLINRSSRPRRLELTTCCELVAGDAAADAAHPAFAGLFAQVEPLPGATALLASRRRRSPQEQPAWVLHSLHVHADPGAGGGVEPGAASWTDDRAEFIGRGGNLLHPAAVLAGGALSGARAQGEPLAALRRALLLPPGGRAIIDIVYGCAVAREPALALAEKYHDPRLVERGIELAWSHARAVLAQHGLDEAEGHLAARLAGAVLYPNPARRAPAAVLARNRRGQDGLWAMGISGDLPIVLLRLADPERVELARQLVRCHAWWRAMGVECDLVLLNEDPSSYRQDLHQRLLDLVGAAPQAGLADRPGGVFVRRSDQLGEDDQILLQSAARVVIGDQGTLAEYVASRTRVPRPAQALEPRLARHYVSPPPSLPEGLVATHPWGGFMLDGTHVALVAPRRPTPAPWANVIANPQYGSIVSEAGSACTWFGNAQLFRITPWGNDPVGDTGGEHLWLRDEDTGRAWPPTGWPRPTAPVMVRHGQGWSSFTCHHEGIEALVTVWVDAQDPVKHVELRLANRSGRPRSLTATSAWEWVLGDRRERTASHLLTERIDLDHEGDAPSDLAGLALLARNPYQPDFAACTAFALAGGDGATAGWTCDRAEFLGRNGHPAQPAVNTAALLVGRCQAGLDPCAVLRRLVALPAGETRTLRFALGCAEDRAAALELARRSRVPAAAAASLAAVQSRWRELLAPVKVETPDAGFDLLVNHWLPYQVLSCRMWARAAYYQSGGAYGFRDQLQDAAGLVHHDPGILREHLLRCAGRQFSQGDVQHWWHPPQGRGVRTTCSDDYLWLPWAILRHLDAGGDAALLDEPVPFLEGRALRAGEHAAYERPTVASERASVYEHGVRALLHGLRHGARGLPLMGGGDWNDGMDLVGAEGRGESVWLGFFLQQLLTRYGALAARRGDDAFAARCAEEAGRLAEALEREAWDGRWYVRAWDDAGNVLGGAAASECRIDLLPQAWAVLTACGDPARARLAMASAAEALLDPQHGLLRLFTPPFDQGMLEPGYIKGYPPGVRENGGQYSHAATWGAIAWAKLGDRERAWQAWRCLSPLARHHHADVDAAKRYAGEPYVLAADIRGAGAATGRAGWTWYTGSAGWACQLALEHLLGFQREGMQVRLRPCLPADWPGFVLRYRHGASRWRIAVQGAGPWTVLSVDGRDGEPDTGFTLVDDGREHAVELR